MSEEGLEKQEKFSDSSATVFYLILGINPKETPQKN